MTVQLGVTQTVSGEVLFQVPGSPRSKKRRDNYTGNPRTAALKRENPRQPSRGRTHGNSHETQRGNNGNPPKKKQKNPRPTPR
jgi:hypothetical protein